MHVAQFIYNNRCTNRKKSPIWFIFRTNIGQVPTKNLRLERENENGNIRARNENLVSYLTLKIHSSAKFQPIYMNKIILQRYFELFSEIIRSCSREKIKIDRF